MREGMGLQYVNASPGERPFKLVIPEAYKLLQNLIMVYFSGQQTGI
jgi:hypothetical protein